MTDNPANSLARLGPTSATITVRFANGAEQVIDLADCTRMDVAFEQHIAEYNRYDVDLFGPSPFRSGPGHRYKVTIDAEYPTGSSGRPDGRIATVSYRLPPARPPVAPPPLVDRLIGRLPRWLQPLATVLADMLRM